MAHHWKKRETLFAEYGIRLVLPGHWQLRPSGEAQRWVYRSADRREQVTITLGEIPLGGNDGGTLIRRAVTRHRKAVELGFARAQNLEMTEPAYDEVGDVPAAHYEGAANDGRHHFHALLLFPERSVWGIFYEAFGLSEEDAAGHAEAVFETAAFGVGSR